MLRFDIHLTSHSNNVGIARKQISCPLGLVVKRITSMTFESANDKIARSIRAEGILFSCILFALILAVGIL